MNNSPLLKFIRQYTFVTDLEATAILNYFQLKEIQKGEQLLKEGQVCRHLYFLEKGLLHFYVVKDEKQHTKFFTLAPYMFTSQVSFTQQVPAKENIEALEDCLLWKISLADANHLLALPPWSTFVRMLIQQVQEYTENILEDMQSKTAEERYRAMLMQTPDLLQRIPLKYVASYLGVAPQSLSRIRKTLHRS